MSFLFNPFSGRFDITLSASEILTKILTVDGAGTGLDSDLLDGQHGSYYAPLTSLSSYVLKAGDTMTGALLFIDNTIDIGASGATRPRTIYVGTSIINPLLIGGTSTTADLTLQTTSGVGTTGADMHFLVGNNGATEAITILNTGNVGIGITAPTAKLHIVGSANTQQLIVKANATQTANLTEWQNSSGTVLSCIDGAGKWGLANGQAAVTIANVLVYAVNTVTVTTGSPAAMVFLTQSNPGASSSATLYGVNGATQTSPGNAQNHTGSLTGGAMNFIHWGSGTVTKARGVFGYLECKSTGNITAGNVFEAYVEPPASTGIIQTIKLCNLRSISTGHTGTNYALYVESQTVGGTNYAIYTNAGTIHAGDKIEFTQTDGNEAIDSANDGYMDYYATTLHRFNNPLTIANIKSGATQAAAGAAANELWKTASHATLPDNVVLIGV